MISYLGTWAVAAQHGITTEQLRSRRDQAPPPDALIGAEITTPVAVPAGGRVVAGWLAANLTGAAPTGAQPVRYVGVPQLAARWNTRRGTVAAALTRWHIQPDAAITHADLRHVWGFLPTRLAELDAWAEKALHRPRAVHRAGPGRPSITEPSSDEIAGLVANGVSLRQVAAQTGVSRETARTRYRDHIRA